MMMMWVYLRGWIEIVSENRFVSFPEVMHLLCPITPMGSWRSFNDTCNKKTGVADTYALASKHPWHWEKTINFHRCCKWLLKVLQTANFLEILAATGRYMISWEIKSQRWPCGNAHCLDSEWFRFVDASKVLKVFLRAFQHHKAMLVWDSYYIWSHVRIVEMLLFVVHLVDMGVSKPSTVLRMDTCNEKPKLRTMSQRHPSWSFWVFQKRKVWFFLQ